MLFEDIANDQQTLDQGQSGPMDEKQLDHMLDANIFNPELAQIDNKTIEDVFNDVLDPQNINSPGAGGFTWLLYLN